MSRPGRERLADLKVPAGLCADCAHLVLLASARSVFVRCGLAESDPRFPRYPPLPVRACPGHRPVEEEGEDKNRPSSGAGGPDGMQSGSGAR